MKYNKCKDCNKRTLLTRHSEIGGHAVGTGYTYICRDCHDIRDNCVNKRKSVRTQKGSNGKRAKGTRRKK